MQDKEADCAIFNLLVFKLNVLKSLSVKNVSLNRSICTKIVT